ncbi:DUF3106 domain-containing protein [Ramlibacter sp. G-1-2-2]|uniref:DUF3106 domain-containing protein n=1 Tax=Ramlibacter agri TaxID=2728837 RepID=A0A848H7S2_9BURK|nr:DUF3106 domain-containing protein [Ramlibacter agri]NML45549.1 DUF3106 domain-containing protein [Ramlibacter agri]
MPAPAAPPVVAVPSASQPPKPSVSTHQAMKPGQPRMAKTVRTESSPTWNELTADQKKALEPLASSWSRLGTAHKRKWLAVSSNFPTMPPAEQARLHSRMAEWAALSPQQRTLARLNFAETQALPVDDKRAKWEAYQNLSPEEKKKLAAGAGKPVPPTAAAVHPAPQKLTAVPPPRKNDAQAPRIAVAPGKIDHNTLLPAPGTLPASQP